MKTYENVAGLHLNLEKIIGESRDVAQALNEFADTLEQIEKKYAEPQKSTDEESEVEDDIVDRPKCMYCEYATLKSTDPPCYPCFCTTNRPNFKPNESCKKLYSKIKEENSKLKYMSEEAYKEWRKEFDESHSNNTRR